MNELRVGHGLARGKQAAILTPLAIDQKQKAAEAAFCLKYAPGFHPQAP
jgi:hypothetical protein